MGEPRKPKDKPILSKAAQIKADKEAKISRKQDSKKKQEGGKGRKEILRGKTRTQTKLERKPRSKRGTAAKATDLRNLSAGRKSRTANRTTKLKNEKLPRSSKLNKSVKVASEAKSKGKSMPVSVAPKKPSDGLPKEIQKIMKSMPMRSQRSLRKELDWYLKFQATKIEDTLTEENRKLEEKMRDKMKEEATELKQKQESFESERNKFSREQKKFEIWVNKRNIELEKERKYWNSELKKKRAANE